MFMIASSSQDGEIVNVSSNGDVFMMTSEVKERKGVDDRKNRRERRALGDTNRAKSESIRKTIINPNLNKTITKIRAKPINSLMSKTKPFESEDKSIMINVVEIAFDIKSEKSRMFIIRPHRVDVVSEGETSIDAARVVPSTEMSVRYKIILPDFKQQSRRDDLFQTL